jgi:hypothetical protein
LAKSLKGVLQDPGLLIQSRKKFQKLFLKTFFVFRSKCAVKGFSVLSDDRVMFPIR